MAVVFMPIIFSNENGGYRMLIVHDGALMRVMVGEAVTVQLVRVRGAGIEVVSSASMRVKTAQRIGLLVGGHICTAGLTGALALVSVRGEAVAS